MDGVPNSRSQWKKKHGATFTYGLPNMSPTKKGAKIFPKTITLRGSRDGSFIPVFLEISAAKLSRMFFSALTSCITLHKTNSWLMKIDGWKRLLSFWEGLFSGAMLVLGIVICRSFVGELKRMKLLLYVLLSWHFARVWGTFLGWVAPALEKFKDQGSCSPPKLQFLQPQAFGGVYSAWICGEFECNCWFPILQNVAVHHLAKWHVTDRVSSLWRPGQNDR